MAMYRSLNPTGITEEWSLLFVPSIDHHIGYCRVEGNIKTFTYTWEIANFWDIYQTMLPLESECMESQYVYFRLDTDESKQNLQFYIVCDENCTGVCRMFLKNSELNFSKTINISNSRDKMEHLCNISIISLLEKSTEYLPDNTLTLYFECKWHIGVSQKAIYTKMSQSYIKSETNMSEVVLDKKSLLTFVIGDVRLYANKNLICAKSTVFQAMFNCETKKDVTNEVQITDIRCDIFKLLICYIQFSFLPDLDVENIETLSELFIAANKYDIQDLKSLCELQLIKLINTENCIKLLKKMFIYLHNTKYLENYIQEFTQVQPKSMFNPELAKLIETNSEFLLYVTKYTKIHTVPFCDTKTSSRNIIMHNKQNTKREQIAKTSQKPSEQFPFGKFI